MRRETSSVETPVWLACCASLILGLEMDSIGLGGNGMESSVEVRRDGFSENVVIGEDGSGDATLREGRNEGP